MDFPGKNFNKFLSGAHNTPLFLFIFSHTVKYNFSICATKNPAAFPAASPCRPHIFGQFRGFVPKFDTFPTLSVENRQGPE